ncbi:hypothetical protein GCM10028807_26800 [Spirosoma daeguense]
MNLFAATHTIFYSCLFTIGLLTSCQPKAELTPVPQTAATNKTNDKDFQPIAQAVNLPITVDYHDYEGMLAHLVYRSTFTYDNQNRLLNISDQLTDSPGSNSSSWVQFQYTDNRLTSIDLKSISANSDDPIYDEDRKPARFELTYSGQNVAARLFIGGKEVQKSSIMLDEKGLPVKSSFKKLFFDEKGNIDFIAKSRAFPLVGTEIIEQRYDANPTVFSQLREMQLLDGLLSSVNRFATSSGLTGLGSSLSTNNLIYTKRKNCDPKYGCKEIDEPHIQAVTLNGQGFPNQLICSMGALGNYKFTVAYKQVKN